MPDNNQIELLIGYAIENAMLAGKVVHEDDLPSIGPLLEAINGLPFPDALYLNDDNKWCVGWDLPVRS